MNAKDIITLSATFLQLEDVLDMSILGGTSETFSDETQKKINLLKKCVGLIYEEIATDYLKLLQVDKAVVYDNKLLFKDLTKNIIKLVSVKNTFNESVNFKLMPDGIILPNGEYEITYTYYPDKINEDDLLTNLEDFSGRVTARVLAYGVCSEYALINGLFEEAQTYRTRFEDAMKAIKVKKTATILPRRRWI